MNRQDLKITVHEVHDVVKVIKFVKTCYYLCDVIFSIPDI